MSGTWDAPDYRLLGDEHVRRYQATDGEEGYLWNGAPTLLLTTTGRRSGEARTCALIFGTEGDDHLVVASKGGMPEHPAWYLNLLADPAARIQVRGEAHEVVAHTAGREDKARLWAVMQAVWPNYDRYQERTDREIPVVVLRRS